MTIHTITRRFRPILAAVALAVAIAGCGIASAPSEHAGTITHAARVPRHRHRHHQRHHSQPTSAPRSAATPTTAAVVTPQLPPKEATCQGSDSGPVRVRDDYCSDAVALVNAVDSPGGVGNVTLIPNSHLETFTLSDGQTIRCEVTDHYAGQGVDSGFNWSCSPQDSSEVPGPTTRIAWVDNGDIPLPGNTNGGNCDNFSSSSCR